MVRTGGRALEYEAPAEPFSGLRNLWLGGSLALQRTAASAFDIATPHFFVSRALTEACKFAM